MMVRHASLFSQLLAFFDRNKFKNLGILFKNPGKGFWIACLLAQTF